MTGHRSGVADTGCVECIFDVGPVQYITAINGYLIPFFGKHNIDSIDYALLNQFDDWRREKLGRVPLLIATEN